MPAAEQLSTWLVTSIQGLYGWAYQSAQGLVQYLEGIGKALLG